MNAACSVIAAFNLFDFFDFAVRFMRFHAVVFYLRTGTARTAKKRSIFTKALDGILRKRYSMVIFTDKEKMYEKTNSFK
jgi:hypothetical protein